MCLASLNSIFCVPVCAAYAGTHPCSPNSPTSECMDELGEGTSNKCYTVSFSAFKCFPLHIHHRIEMSHLFFFIFYFLTPAFKTLISCFNLFSLWPPTSGSSWNPVLWLFFSFESFMNSSFERDTYIYQKYMGLVTFKQLYVHVKE